MVVHIDCGGMLQGYSKVDAAAAQPSLECLAALPLESKGGAPAAYIQKKTGRLPPQIYWSNRSLGKASSVPSDPISNPRLCRWAEWCVGVAPGHTGVFVMVSLRVLQLHLSVWCI